jgi:TPP-dependent pyruvate/acetoin dehydrogenase alpha subunit
MAPSRALLESLYRRMLLLRLAEEKVAELYPQQEMRSPVHLYIGQEAVAAGVCAHLTPKDYVFGSHRSHGCYLAQGGSLKAMFAELYGKRAGCAAGRGGSMHMIDEAAGFMGTSALVGGTLPMAVGAAWAASLRKTDAVGVSFFGDAAVEEGVFSESLNFAALKRLPVLLVCENNLYATNTPLEDRQPPGEIRRRGEPFGVPGVRVDGNDVLAVYAAAGEAVARARKGGGPTLLEAMTYRWKGHVGPDGDAHLGYRSQAEVDAWMARCPIRALEPPLRAAGGKPEEIRAGVARDVAEAVAFGQAAPFPDPAELGLAAPHA